MLWAACLVVGVGALKHFTYEVVDTQPHSTAYFTQGLLFRQPDNRLVEGTGIPGQSMLALYSSSSVGNKLGVELKRPIPNDEHFGEGIAQINQALYQLTWRNGKVMVWDSQTLEWNRTIDLPREMAEGWGLTTSAGWTEQLIASEGSAKLFWLSVADGDGTLRVDREVVVRDCQNNKLVTGLNELETMPLRLTHPELASKPIPSVITNHQQEDVELFAKREMLGVKPSQTRIGATVWGNVYGTPCIAIIDPESGDLLGYLHLDGLGGTNQEADVLNGIAFKDDGTETVWVTGKRWDKLYQIKIHPIGEDDTVTGPIANYVKKCQATFVTQPRQKYPSSTGCPNKKQPQRDGL
ncbi:hypothetical protein BASA81_006507 [Batrachochytrium salamandrivorans]|nr:hypothetical protein BASA81_006507 [Batrachochytrium salamandrivorans]